VGGGGPGERVPHVDALDEVARQFGLHGGLLGRLHRHGKQPRPAPEASGRSAATLPSVPPLAMPVVSTASGWALLPTGLTLRLNRGK
jgi:hypothetical protein